MKLREGMQRLMFFGVFILLSIHIFTCLWIFLANMNKERNWLTLKRESILDSGEKIGGNIQTYFLSLYFVTQTFTTVGYGDVSPSGTGERCFVVLMMLIGVFTFSFASGSLASIMQNVDSESAQINEKLSTLDNVAKTFDFSPQLYEDLKNVLSIEGNNPKQDNEDLEEIMKNLPHKLRLQVLSEVHRDLETTFQIFQKVSSNKGTLLQFLSNSFECEYFKPDDFLYRELDKIIYCYFIQKGSLEFIVPRFENAVFYKVNQGDIVGLEDYIYNLTNEGVTFEDDNIPLEEFEADDYGRRRFNLRTNS